jgi:hypothetical protein
MAEPASCCALPGSYCARTDALFNEPGVHVLDVGWDDGRLRLTVETNPEPVGCARCGVLAVGHGRRLRLLHDIPAFGAPVEVCWRVRRWRCLEPDCQGGVFTEEHDLAPPRDKLTIRAAWRAVSVIARDTASVAAVARRLGVDWHTLWSAIKPLLRQLADDPAGAWGLYESTLLRIHNEALAAANLDIKEIDRVLLPFLHRGGEQAENFDVLGYKAEQSSWDYGRTVGHLGAGDHFAGIHHLMQTGAIGTGDRLMMIGAGIGFNFVAVVIEIL